MNPMPPKRPKTGHQHQDQVPHPPKLLSDEEKNQAIVVTQMTPDGLGALAQFAKNYCPEMRVEKAVVVRGLPDDKAEALKTLIFRDP